MHSFEEYLQQHNIEPLAVSIKAHVRYFIVWNAIRGNPIVAEHAQMIRQAVLSLTGVPYTGSFVLTQRRPVDQVPILSIKKITHHH